MRKIFIFILIATGYLVPAYALQEEAVCTMEAKMCSDGSYVGRTGPNCEFAACPGETSNTGTNTGTGNDIFCTREYAPVCGEVQVQCIMAPCYPVQETFSNRCELNRNSNATYLHDGQCTSDSGSGNLNMSNPASEYCNSVGGVSQIATKPDGSQYGTCVFEEGRMCEEWALYRGDCSVGGRKLTGYLGDYAKYCAITGNEFVNKGTDQDGNDIGDCNLISGETVDAKMYYNGLVNSTGSTNNSNTDDTFVCPMIYSPVCGNDGKTYGNSCSAQKVGVKYNGNCIGINNENKVENAWNSALKNASDGLSASRLAMVLERVIGRAKVLSEQNPLDSLKASVYNFIIHLGERTLQTSIYEEYIKSYISIISPVSPTSGTNWVVSDIEWLDTSRARVTYEDLSISRTIVIELNSDATRINVNVIEE